MFVAVVAVGIAAYFVPLYRAHALLLEQYRDLSQKSQKQAQKLAQTETDLEAAKRTRDQHEAERKQREVAAKADGDRLELVRGELAPRLDKAASKGLALVWLPDRSGLVIGIDESLVLVPLKGKVSPDGPGLLCDIGKVAGAAGSLSLRAIHTAGKSGRAPAPFESVFAWSAARAGAVAQALAQCGGKEPMRIVAVGAAKQDPYGDLLAAGKLPPARIEVAILPASAP